MPQGGFTRRAVHNLHSLSTALIREKAAARILRELGGVDGSQFIDEVLVLAKEGWEPAYCVLSSVVSALANEPDLVNDRELKRLARSQELLSVEALFTEAKAIREYHAGAAAKADAKLFTDSLGHLKERARLTRNPDELARLVQASEPSVIRNALLNPRVTHDLVVRIAAKRPARPEPLIEIWRSPRWSVQNKVRRALVFNPYLPPEIGCKIVPLLNHRDLRELVSDRAVHPAIRAQASRLIESRPAVANSPSRSDTLR